MDATFFIEELVLFDTLSKIWFKLPQDPQISVGAGWKALHVVG